MAVTLERYGDLLLAYLRPQGVKVLALAVLLLGNVGLQLVNPQILRSFIDAARAGSTLHHLLAVGLLYLAVAALSYVVTIGETYLGEDVGWSATNALRADLALHLLRLDMS
jgi:ABC-type multidrug transport system fused ATPase/permease subunit